MNLSKPTDRIVVITDTTCLIILEKISLLPLLHQLFDKIITTPEIADEYRLTMPDWVTIVSVTNNVFQQELSLIVDKGEASAIALAMEIENHFLITDDLDARKLSTKFGLNIIGTLGVILRAKEHGLIPNVKPFLELIKQTNFRISDRLYQTALVKAGEL